MPIKSDITSSLRISYCYLFYGFETQINFFMMVGIIQEILKRMVQYFNIDWTQHPRTLKILRKCRARSFGGKLTRL